MAPRFGAKPRPGANGHANCRLQKRARASLSLRLPRSRPSAVGVDSRLFGTPPSVEDSTPEKEAAKTVLDESVAGSVLIEAPSPAGGTPKGPQTPEDRFVLAEHPDINPNPHSLCEIELYPHTLAGHYRSQATTPHGSKYPTLPDCDSYASNAGARIALRVQNTTCGGRIRRLTQFTRSPSWVLMQLMGNVAASQVFLVQLSLHGTNTSFAFVQFMIGYTAK
ncbi:unnamed protein product, partial [Iphiclides podalirius]